MLSFFKRVMNAISSRDTGVESVEKEIAGFSAYFEIPLTPLESAPDRFPAVTDMRKFGLEAYRLLFMPSHSSLLKLRSLIIDFGFDTPLGQISNFNILRRKSGETLFVGEYAEFRGVVLVLLTNSVHFLKLVQALELEPKAPWIVFPDVDAEGLGRMEGELGYWWENHWLQFWGTLNKEEQDNYLEQNNAPADWIEFFNFYAELNRPAQR